ncbi:UNVERIFIED_CONTAM: hypothetical protein GTU68_041962 [Idotea baltica]|nr:hypothetical protein [Idotea baltica]
MCLIQQVELSLSGFQVLASPK